MKLLEEYKNIKGIKKITALFLIMILTISTSGFVNKVESAQVSKSQTNDSPISMGVSAHAYVVMDANSGEIIMSQDADKKIYIQSAFRMDTEKKESSELASLMLTKDFFKKIIVRMDVPHNFYDDDGIFHCNLIDLLLNRVELF